MLLRNTTNLSDSLIVYVTRFCLEELVGRPEPEIITVKNKMNGKVHGQLGWYHPRDKHVIVIVPRVVDRPVVLRRKYSRTRDILRSRADFLVSTMAHELRHHWQQLNWVVWQLASRPFKEVDAISFERKVLAKWHEHTGVSTTPVIHQANSRTGT